MKCPKCGSDNVNVQVVSESTLKNKSKSCAYWLFIGWWFELLKWLFLTIPMLLGKMFGHKDKEIVVSHKSMAVCQNCGKHWKV